MQFVIIGGDAAGMSAASRAKRNMPQLEVTVLEKTGDVSYSACGMPYNIGDPTRSIEDLVVRSADVFRQKQGINLLTGHTVESIDPAAGRVAGTTAEGRAFEYPYDRLLIATGARPILPDLPGVDLPGVVGLKSLQDGRKIKQLIADGLRQVVIVGMGYIALEMAEALRALDLEVAMVKPRAEFLPWLPAELAQVVREEVESHQVAVHTGRKIDRIESAGGRLRVVCEAIDLAADLVLVAVGVTPNSDIAAAAGIDLGPAGAVSINRRMQTSQPRIYAAGDCADAYHVVTGKKVWIPLALRANRAGWAAADNVIGEVKELPGIAGTAVFKTFEMEVARTGLTVDEAAAAGFAPEAVSIRSRSRAHAHPDAATIHVHMVADRDSGCLLGVQMVGREGVAHRINAPAVALHAGMTVEEFSQCDLAYAPPFGPTWDPMLTAANQLLKRL